MNISEKIKQARLAVGCSQEEVAEKVGVSRQSISNWENGRTYPDIASVIIMSDFYNMTLDALLKEDHKLIKHYKESTDIAKSNKQVVLSLILLMVVGVAYLLLHAFITNSVILSIAPMMAYVVFMIVICIKERGVNMFLLGLGIFFIFNALFIVILGGSITDYMNFAALMMIVIPLLSILVATRSFRVFFAGLRAALLPKRGITDELREQAICLFRSLSKAASIVAAIVVIISFVNMNINAFYSRLDTEFLLTEVIPGLAINTAISFVPVYYALFVIVSVFEPVVLILKKNRNTVK
jgi:transcriptional regulator with XRE-family HTH domain